MLWLWNHVQKNPGENGISLPWTLFWRKAMCIRNVVSYWWLWAWQWWRPKYILWVIQFATPYLTRYSDFLFQPFSNLTRGKENLLFGAPGHLVHIVHLVTWSPGHLVLTGHLVHVGYLVTWAPVPDWSSDPPGPPGAPGHMVLTQEDVDAFWHWIVTFWLSSTNPRRQI